VASDNHTLRAAIRICAPIFSSRSRIVVACARSSSAARLEPLGAPAVAGVSHDYH